MSQNCRSQQQPTISSSPSACCSQQAPPSRICKQPDPPTCRNPKPKRRNYSISVKTATNLRKTPVKSIYRRPTSSSTAPRTILQINESTSYHEEIVYDPCPCNTSCQTCRGERTDRCCQTGNLKCSNEAQTDCCTTNVCAQTSSICLKSAGSQAKYFTCTGTQKYKQVTWGNSRKCHTPYTCPHYPKAKPRSARCSSFSDSCCRCSKAKEIEAPIGCCCCYSDPSSQRRGPSNGMGYVKRKRPPARAVQFSKRVMLRS